MRLRRPTGNGRDQSELITGGENEIIVGVLAIYGQQAAAGVDLPAQRDQRVSDAGAVSQLKLQRIAAGAFAQACK